jgi:hypothetical protein
MPQKPLQHVFPMDLHEQCRASSSLCDFNVRLEDVKECVNYIKHKAGPSKANICILICVNILTKEMAVSSFVLLTGCLTTLSVTDNTLYRIEGSCHLMAPTYLNIFLINMWHAVA